MGSKVYLGDNKYRLYVSNGFRADGKPNRATKTVVATSDRAAQRMLNEFEMEFTKKPPRISNKVTFREFARIFDERHLSKLGPNSQDSDRGVLKNRLVPYFGNIKIFFDSFEI